MKTNNTNDFQFLEFDKYKIDIYLSMMERTISLKLTPELLQKAEAIAGNAENLHDFFVSAIEEEIQRRQSDVTRVDFGMKSKN